MLNNNNEIKFIRVTKDNLFKLYQLESSKKVMGKYQNYFKGSFLQYKKKFVNNKKNIYYFLINIDKKCIGFVYYFFEKRFNTYEIGCTITPNYRGQKIGKLSQLWLIKNIYKKWGKIRIQAITTKSNIAEIKVLRKLKFIKEGVLKKAGKKGSGYYDLEIYAIPR